mmetsp:Transcript_12366/g.51769  ORF Transcript_12366/g.51769 Transcript_12366/m.51769 type:complete len:209 (+) Transcript_12366:2348-2974(+)
MAENVRGPGPVLVHALLQLERVQRRRHGVEGPGRQQRVHLSGSHRVARAERSAFRETSVPSKVERVFDCCVQRRRGDVFSIQFNRASRARVYAHGTSIDAPPACSNASGRNISPLPSRTGSWPPSPRFSRTRRTPRRRVRTGTRERRVAQSPRCPPPRSRSDFRRRRPPCRPPNPPAPPSPPAPPRGSAARPRARARSAAPGTPPGCR